MGTPRGERCEQGQETDPIFGLDPAVLGSVLEAIADGIVVLDPSGELVYCNPAALRLLPLGERRVPLEEWPAAYGLYSAEVGGLLPVEQLPVIRALRGEAGDPVELFVRHAEAPQGLWISACAMPLRDPAGGDRGALMVLRDVTEARRAQEALRRERDWAATVIDTVGSLVVVLDREGRIVSFNRACEITTGYAFEEVLGRPVWELFLVPEEFEQVREVFRRLQAGDFPSQHEHHWMTRGGQRRLIVWSYTVLPDATGVVEYVIGTGIDVTERREAERRARRLDETLRTLLEISPVAIWALDLDGHLQFWNPAAERLFGWSESDVLAQPLAIMAADQPTDFRRLLDGFRKGERLTGVELRLRRKEGTLVEINLWTAPLRDEAGRLTAVLGLAVDVSERKHLAQQLSQAQKMEAIGRLAGGVAHDFNNLLTIVSGYGQMLAESLPADEKLREQVAEILRAAQSAAELTRRLLTFSRKQRAVLRLVDLNKIVGEMDMMLRRVIGEHIELLSVLAPEPMHVRADPVQIEQVILNLVINARDAMPQGGRIVIETASVVFDEDYARTHVGVEPGRYAMLAVSDTGVGMDAETLRQAFEPFFTTKQSGTGLGLSTAYGIVCQHGGRIWAYSEPGVGTTFKIYLPLAEPTAEVAPVELGARPAAGGSETILVAEDQPDLRRLVAEVLRREGYAVLAAASPEEALRLSREHPGAIDLLLTDVVMPGLSGHQLAEAMRRTRPRLKVLYMSGYADRAVAHNGMREAGAAFLEKPFTKHQLLRRLRETLESD